MTWEETERELKGNPKRRAYRTSDPIKFRWLLRWGEPGGMYWWQNPKTGAEHSFTVTAEDMASNWVMA